MHFPWEGKRKVGVISFNNVTYKVTSYLESPGQSVREVSVDNKLIAVWRGVSTFRYKKEYDNDLYIKKEYVDRISELIKAVEAYKRS